MQLVADQLMVWRDFEVSASWKKGAAQGFGASSVQVIYLIGFWLCAVLLQRGNLAVNDVLMTLFCVVFGLSSASVTARYIPDAVTGRIAAYETFRLIDQDSAINALQPAGVYRSLGDGIVAFENVSFAYPHRPGMTVLQSLSFKIQPGSTVALLGASGGGKSTVIQLLQRLYDPDEGSIKVGGVDLRELDVRWWRSQLGFVGQEPVLFDISLEDNIKYGFPEASHEEIVRVAELAHMDYALEGQVSWSGRLGTRGEKLSGGQKQRCALARALLRRPSLLLLDEATSALDSANEKLVLEALRSKGNGLTTLTIAHRLSTVQDADYALVLSSGKLAEHGTFEELLQRSDGILASLAKLEGLGAAGQSA